MISLPPNRDFLHVRQFSRLGAEFPTPSEVAISSRGSSSSGIETEVCSSDEKDYGSATTGCKTIFANDQEHSAVAKGMHLEQSQVLPATLASSRATVVPGVGLRMIDLLRRAGLILYPARAHRLCMLSHIPTPRSLALVPSLDERLG